jgi:ribose/xylose/arabinose/galactoside ABC-type transport system permease subunit
VIELTIAACELIFGMAVGFVGGRRGGRWLPIIVALGVFANLGGDLRASQTYACPAGADCNPVTWANWAWLGIAMVGWWLLAVTIGYALTLRFDRTS